MEIQKYLDEKRDIIDRILQFLDDDQTNDSDFQKIIEIINIQQKESYGEFMQFIQLILDISINHYRSSIFFKKIIMIIEYIAILLTKTLSNIEIFDVFKKNKLILLFLFDNKIITFDQNIYIQMKQISEMSKNFKDYCQFFYPEIKKLIEDKIIDNSFILNEPENMDKFDENRHIGENDSYICSLIRQDSVEEFVSYMNRSNTSPSFEIKTSFFETNPFLLDKKPSLIEYSAFFGSIQIFKYLHFCKAEVTPSIWLYAIHGQNAELIHYLESNEINPPENSYELCFIEAIKCFHNAIANYIYDNFLIEKVKQSQKVLDTVLQNHNYEFLSSDFNDENYFISLCSHKYYDLVDVLLKAKENIIKQTIINKSKLFVIQFQ